jgi:glycolate oxidase
MNVGSHARQQRIARRRPTTILEDVTVPRTELATMVTFIAETAQRLNLEVGTFGHMGDGNLHPNLIFDRDDPRAEEVTEASRAEMYRAALSMGGTVTAEHGIGLARRDFLELQRGADAVRVMRSIKDALDPLGILNPGRVLPRRPNSAVPL